MVLLLKYRVLRLETENELDDSMQILNIWQFILDIFKNSL